MSSPVIAADNAFRAKLNREVAETLTRVLTEETDSLHLPAITWELTDDGHIVGTAPDEATVDTYADDLGHGFTFWGSVGRATDVRIAGRWVQVRERAS